MDRLSVDLQKADLKIKASEWILGVLAASALAAVVAGQEPEHGWNKLIRGAIFVPATKRIDEQLREFRLTRTHISIVIDEFGARPAWSKLELLTLAAQKETAPRIPWRAVVIKRTKRAQR